MRGILLAGGKGSRLDPLTRVVSKHLLPVYDKPMIYYPLVTLMQAGIREVLVISSPQDLASYRSLLGNGSRWGLSLSYAKQLQPEGIAQALVIGASFIKDRTCCLILGDNVLVGKSLTAGSAAPQFSSGALVYAKSIRNPSEYGVVSLDARGRAISIIEKPLNSDSRWALIGVYVYDQQVGEIARSIKPSSRGELEITDVNIHYLRSGQLRVRKLGPGYAWFDAGTPNRLMDASCFVRQKMERKGGHMACPAEVAFQNGWISAAQVEAEASQSASSTYRSYLLGVLARETTVEMPKVEPVSAPPYVSGLGRLTNSGSLIK